MKTRLLFALTFVCISSFAQTTNPLHEKAKAILACFAKEDYTGITKYFDETMKKKLPPEKLKEVWNMLNQQAGTYIKPSAIEDTIYQQYRIVYITCIFQNAKLKLKTVFNSEGQIAGLFFVPENAPKP